MQKEEKIFSSRSFRVYAVVGVLLLSNATFGARENFRYALPSYGER